MKDDVSCFTAEHAQPYLCWCWKPSRDSTCLVFDSGDCDPDPEDGKWMKVGQVTKMLFRPKRKNMMNKFRCQIVVSFASHMHG